MKLLLDTHFLVWMASDPEEIGDHERRALTGDETVLLASAISLWELRVKRIAEQRRRRPPSVVPPDQALKFCEANGIAVLPITGGDCGRSLAVPVPHNDPFDEMLLVHAQQHDALLLTRDRDLLAHPLAYQP